MINLKDNTSQNQKEYNGNNVFNVYQLLLDKSGSNVLVKSKGSGKK